MGGETGGDGPRGRLLAAYQSQALTKWWQKHWGSKDRRRLKGWTDTQRDWELGLGLGLALGWGRWGALFDRRTGGMCLRLFTFIHVNLLYCTLYCSAHTHIEAYTLTVSQRAQQWAIVDRHPGNRGRAKKMHRGKGAGAVAAEEAIAIHFKWVTLFGVGWGKEGGRCRGVLPLFSMKSVS